MTSNRRKLDYNTYQEMMSRLVSLGMYAEPEMQDAVLSECGVTREDLSAYKMLDISERDLPDIDDDAGDDFLKGFGE